MAEQLHGESHADSFPSSGSSGTVNLEHGEPAIISTAARQLVPTTVSTTPVSQTGVRSSLDSADSALSHHRSLPGSPRNMSVTGLRKPRLVQFDSERRVPALPNGGASTVRNVSQKVVVTGSSIGRVKDDTGDAEADQRLSLGIHYVPGLGGDDAESAVFYMTPSVGKNPSPLVGAGKSPASPTGVPGSSGARSMSTKSLAPGKPQPASRHQFKKIPIGAPFAISVQFETIPARGAGLLVRQQDGRPAPAWVNLDERDVELWGVPLKEHQGTHLLEVVESTQSGQRVVARMSLEVVEWE
jgi:hypothetical protein